MLWQPPGEAPHFRSGYPEEVGLAAWQPRTYSQRKLPTASGSAFRPPGEKSYPPTFTRQTPWESSSTSEQPPRPTPDSHLNRERASCFVPSCSKETFPDCPQPMSYRLWWLIPFQIHLSSGHRPHCLGHSASLAPGFLSLPTSVLILKDKLSVLLHWCWCN